MGAKFWTLLRQTMALMLNCRVCEMIHIAKEHAPTFHVWNIVLDREMRTSKHARKFAIGARGYGDTMV